MTSYISSVLRKEDNVVSATGQSLVQRSPTDYMCVTEYDQEQQ